MESDLNSSPHEQISVAQLAILAIIFSVGRGLQIFARAFTDFIDKVGGRVWKVRDSKTDSMKKRP